MSLGCFTIEYLGIDEVNTKNRQLQQRHEPMTYAFRSKENSVVYIHICRGPISYSLACVENEWNIDPFHLLTLAESQKGFYVVYKWF